MPTSIQDLQSERLSLTGELRTCIDEAEARGVRIDGGDSSTTLWPADERAKYDRINTRLSEVEAELRTRTEREELQARRRAIEDFEREHGQGGQRSGGHGRPNGATPPALDGDARSHERDREAALRCFLLGDGAEGTERFRDGAERFAQRSGRRLTGTGVSARLLDSSSARAVFRGEHRGSRAVELRVGLDTATATSGAELLPTRWAALIDEATHEANPMMGLVELLRTTDGNDMVFRDVDDTANKGRYLAEKAESQEADPVTGKVTIGAHDASSDVVRVSVQLIQDTEFDLTAYIAGLLGTRIGRLSGEAMTVGNGTNKPRGFILDATVGKTAASQTAIAADELIDLFHSVPEPFRSRSAWQMNDKVVAAIRKLKDSDGQYLWQPGLSPGEPQMLLGKAIYANPDMVATPVATAKPLAFGDFGRYRFRQVTGVNLVVYRELYMRTREIGIEMFERHDGRLFHKSKSVKVLQMAPAG